MAAGTPLKASLTGSRSKAEADRFQLMIIMIIVIIIMVMTMMMMMKMTMMMKRIRTQSIVDWLKLQGRGRQVSIDHHHCGDDNPGHPDYGDDNVNDGGGEMTMMVKRIRMTIWKRADRNWS